MYRQTMNTRATLAQRYPVTVTVVTVASVLVCVFGFVEVFIDHLIK